MEVVSLLGRVLAVFLLLGATLWVLRRTDARSRGRRGAPLQVLGSARLSRGASVTVVRIGGEDVVLGVTEHTVTLLGPAGSAEPAGDGSAESTESTGSTGSTGSTASAGSAGSAGDADSPTAAEAGPAAPPAVALGRTPVPADFRAALAAELERAGALPGVPPTTGQFLRSAYRAARSRSATSEVSPAAVQAALSSVRDGHAGTTEPPGPPAAQEPALAVVPPVAPAASVALRRAVSRSRAQRAAPARLEPATAGD